MATTIKSRVTEPVFRLKLSESAKFKKEGQWFKDYINYLVPYDTTVVDDYKQMKLSYDLVNNNIDGYKKELERFINPMGEDDMLPEGYEDEILPYSRIHNKVNVLVGELLKRRDDLKIVLLSDKEVKDKSEAQKEAIRQSIEEQVQIMIEKVRMQQQGMTEEQIKEQMDAMRTQLEPEDLANKSFLTEWEIFNTRALEFCYYDQYVLDKQQLTLRQILY